MLRPLLFSKDPSLKTKAKTGGANRMASEKREKGKLYVCALKQPWKNSKPS